MDYDSATLKSCIKKLIRQDLKCKQSTYGEALNYVIEINLCYQNYTKNEHNPILPQIKQLINATVQYNKHQFYFQDIKNEYFIEIFCTLLDNITSISAYHFDVVSNYFWKTEMGLNSLQRINKIFQKLLKVIYKDTEDHEDLLCVLYRNIFHCRSISVYFNLTDLIPNMINHRVLKLQYDHPELSDILMSHLKNTPFYIYLNKRLNNEHIPKTNVRDFKSIYIDKGYASTIISKLSDNNKKVIFDQTDAKYFLASIRKLKYIKKYPIIDVRKYYKLYYPEQLYTQLIDTHIYLWIVLRLSEILHQLSIIWLDFDFDFVYEKIKEYIDNNHMSPLSIDKKITLKNICVKTIILQDIETLYKIFDIFTDDYNDHYPSSWVPQTMKFYHKYLIRVNPKVVI